MAAATASRTGTTSAVQRAAREGTLGAAAEIPRKGRELLKGRLLSGKGARVGRPRAGCVYGWDRRGTGLGLSCRVGLASLVIPFICKSRAGPFSAPSAGLSLGGLRARRARLRLARLAGGS